MLLARDFAYWKQIMMFSYSVSFKTIIQGENPQQPLCGCRGQFRVSRTTEGLSAAVGTARWIYCHGCSPAFSQRSVCHTDCRSDCLSTGLSRSAPFEFCCQKCRASKSRPQPPPSPSQGLCRPGPAAPRAAFSSRKGKSVCTSPSVLPKAAARPRSCRLLGCRVPAETAPKVPAMAVTTQVAAGWSGKDGCRRVRTSLPFCTALCLRILATAF